MQKTILTIVGSALLAASAVQIAAAAEYKGRKAERAPQVSERVRNVDAYAFVPASPPEWSRYYEGGASSAPAGR
jgi:hypothetical protein